ncbi:MAG TPA: DNA methyltransferase [Opitutaceae bacterium]|nr:DNA methyltransferase [Opitutaceae bacterium]
MKLTPRDAPEVEHDAWRGQCAWVTFKRSELCTAAAPIKTEPAVVLDPFGGAGTTGLVADRLGRDAVLVEISQKCAEMARRRISDDPPLFAKVAAE